MASGETRDRNVIDPARDRSNKATVTTQSLTTAFQEGFEEGQRSATMVWTYEVTYIFEGTKLRVVQYGDSRQMLAEIADHIANGPGTRVEIDVKGEPLQPKTTSIPNDDEVVDAEVLPPSQD